MRKFEPVIKELQKNDGEVMLPLRGTKTSAGYDFYTPIDLEIKPQDKVFFWTDVKAIMPEGEVLLLDVRSSCGTKLDLMLANTIPVIDSDYAQAKNGGNIGIMLRNLRPSMELIGTTILNLSKEGFNVVNDATTSELAKGFTVEEAYASIRIPIIKDLTEENTIRIPRGERVAQGIFVNYNESENCNTDIERTSGFGSTGR